jgi:uncharacterized protein (TIGR04255 family)
MTEVAHPRYPEPTIAEALCEIYFALPPERRWKPSLPGAFFKRIQDEYPEIEPVQQPDLRIDLVQRRVLPPQQRIRFTHTTHSRLIQLSEDIITVNILAPYPGWETMSEVVLDTWRKAREVLEPSAITRIGLRYINRIKRLSDEDRPGDWLRATDYIPPGVLSSLPGFLLRVEVHQDNQNRLIVTVGSDVSDSAGEFGAVIFDIDRIVEREMPPEEQLLVQEMNRLHEDIWKTFAEAKTDKLTRLLEGREP